MTLRNYIIGFGLSLVFTVLSFGAVVLHMRGEENASPTGILLLVLLLAIVQFVVQLVFFLHLGDEEKPRYNLMTLGFATFVVGVVVVGSLWIMDHLNHMQGHEMIMEIYEGGEITPQAQDD